MAVEGNASSELTKALNYMKEQLDKEQAKARKMTTELDKAMNELASERSENSKLEKEVGYLKSRETHL